MSAVAQTLADPVAQRLLHSTIPTRFAYLGADGAPRVVPIWSQWTGEHLVIGTFVGSAKLAALCEGDPVAVTIDTDVYPYQALQLRGTVALSELPGLVPEYVVAASRYLGAEAAPTFLGRLSGRAMIRVAMTVTGARLMA